MWDVPCKIWFDTRDPKFLDEELPVKYATVEQLKSLGERLDKLEKKGESDGK